MSVCPIPRRYVHKRAWMRDLEQKLWTNQHALGNEWVFRVISCELTSKWTMKITEMLALKSRESGECLWLSEYDIISWKSWNIECEQLW